MILRFQKGFFGPTLIWTCLAAFNELGATEHSGTITTFAGSATSGDGQLAAFGFLGHVSGMAFNQRIGLILADAIDHRIRRVDLFGRISTLVGTGQPGYLDGPNGADALVRSPVAVGVDSRGNVIFSDSGNDRVRMIAPNGGVTTLAGGGTQELLGTSGGRVLASAAKIISPGALAIAPSGSIYVCEKSRHRVLRIDPDGMISVFAGNGRAGLPVPGARAESTSLREPSGLAVDNNGIVYIADSGNYAIRRVVNGNLETVALPGGQETSLGYVTGLGVSENGEILVAEGDRRKVRVFSQARWRELPVTGSALAMGAGGQVFVSQGQRVVQADPLQTIAGNGGYWFWGDGATAEAARFQFPEAVAVASDGAVFVADRLNHRVRKILPTGEISTFAGDGEPGRVNVFALTSRSPLSSPSAVALGPDGGVWIADSTSIRKIHQSGIVELLPQGVIAKPSGLVVSPHGEVFISDSTAHRVFRYNNKDGIVPIAGTGQSGMGGDGQAAIRARLNSPTGLAIDELDGSLLICDTGNGAVRRVGIDGNISTLSFHGLQEPASVGANRIGFVVADRARHQVILLKRDGTGVVVAGIGEPGFSGDGGLARDARLLHPGGLAFTRSGDVLVADSGNHRIRRISFTESLEGVSLSDISLISPLNGKTVPAVPGGLVSVVGIGLGPTVGVLGTLDQSRRLPTTLAGTSVTFDGHAAHIAMAQNHRLDIQAPPAIEGRTHALLEVRTSGSPSPRRKTISVSSTFPQLALSSGAPELLVINQDGTTNSAANPARIGEVITFFATGMGPLEGDLAPGEAPPVGQTIRPKTEVSVDCGGWPAEIVWAGAVSPTGLIQYNIRIPESSRGGRVAISVRAGNLTDRAMSVYIR